MKINYMKWSLIVLSALALIVFTIAIVYGILYLRERSVAQKLQNDAVEEQASLKKPSISVNDISCDIAPDAKIQQYSVVIRTLNAAINSKQQQVEDTIKVLGGTVTSTNQGKMNDPDAGYSTSAIVRASLPVSQVAKFISQTKNSTVPPDYLENENSDIQNSADIKQNCQTTLGYLKNLATTEALYLNQLSSGNDVDSSPAPLRAIPPPAPVPTPSYYPTPPVPTVPYVSYSSNSIAQRLMEVRQSAIDYKNRIDNLMSQINRAEITVTIKEIPG